MLRVPATASIMLAVTHHADEKSGDADVVDASCQSGCDLMVGLLGDVF